MAEGITLAYNVPTTHYTSVSVAIRGLNESLLSEKGRTWDPAKKLSKIIFQVKSPDVAEQYESRLTITHQIIENGRLGGIPLKKYAVLGIQLMLYHEFETSTGEKVVQPCFGKHEYQVPQDVPWDMSSAPWQIAQYIFRLGMSDNDTAFTQNRMRLFLQGITDFLSEPLT